MSNATEGKQLILTNARVKWAHLIRPGKPYDETQAPEWTVNIYPTPEDAEILKAHGANPKEDKEMNEFWVAKRRTKTRDGGDAKPPTVVNTRKEPFTDEVGNNSVCNIAVTLFPWSKGKQGTASYRSGILVYLNAVQVVNHVAQSSGADAFAVIEPQDDGNDLPFN